MFEELIEKIRLILDDPDPEYSEEVQGMRWQFGLEEGIDSAMKLIESCEPPELDAPTEEGWWIIKNRFRLPYAYVYVEGDLIHYSWGNQVCLVANYDGKWQKAIVPNR